MLCLVEQGEAVWSLERNRGPYIYVGGSNAGRKHWKLKKADQILNVATSSDPCAPVRLRFLAVHFKKNHDILEQGQVLCFEL